MVVVWILGDTSFKLLKLSNLFRADCSKNLVLVLIEVSLDLLRTDLFRICRFFRLSRTHRQSRYVDAMSLDLVDLDPIDWQVDRLRIQFVSDCELLKA